MASRAPVEQMMLARSKATFPVVTRSRRTWFRRGSGTARVLLRVCFCFLIKVVSPLAHSLSSFFLFLFTGLH